eukprot:5365503-Prymnesium_polylepis.1
MPSATSVRSTAPSRRSCAPLVRAPHRVPPQPPRRPRLLPLADPRRACPSRQHARGHPRSLRRAADVHRARRITTAWAMGEVPCGGAIQMRDGRACARALRMCLKGL